MHGLGAIEFRSITLAEELAVVPNYGKNTDAWWVVPAREQSERGVRPAIGAIHPYEVTQPGARMNHSKPTQSRVPQRGVALYASFVGCLIIVSMAFSACSPTSNETPAASAHKSPSASDQAEARRQIEAAAIGIWQAVARGDSAAILADYADDALILSSGAPMLQGKPAVAAFLQGLFGGNTLRDVKGNVTDIMISGDLAVETGTYAMTIIPKNGNAVADKGKYIHVWKKSVDGSWKVVRYVPNSDIPPR